jgi:hypothetical protein
VNEPTYTHTDLVLAEDIGREKGRREEREAIEQKIREVPGVPYELRDWIRARGEGS